MEEGKYQVRMVRNAKTGRMSYVLTDEQRDLLIKLYPKRSNAELMKLFGLSFSSLQRLRRSLGLQKDMATIRKQLAERVKEICERNGYYDSLRGKPPSAAAIEASRRRLAEGFKPLEEFRKKHPKQYKAMLLRRGKGRTQLIEKERQRVDWGVPQLSKLHVPFAPFNKRQVSLRNNMKKRGYLPGSAYGNERMTIYYTEETNRSALMEQHAAAAHFTIKYKP